MNREASKKKTLVQHQPQHLGVGWLVIVAAMFFGFSGLACAVVDAQEASRLRDVLALEPGDVVADIGAGDGKWSAVLAQHVGPTGQVWATEVDSKDVQKIERRVAADGIDNVKVVKSTQVDAGLPVRCCDAILLRRVYHHFTKPEVMRREMLAALRPGGLILIVDFEADRGWSRPAGIPEDRAGHGLRQEKILEEMRSSGFRLVRELDWSRGDYALLFRAPGE